MLIYNKREPFLVFLGDLIIFAISLWLSLALRDGRFSSFSDYLNILTPFSIVFLIWVLVFFIAGLYDKYTTILKDKLPGMIVNAQLVNSAIAVAFFYLFPYFNASPKTILFIVIIISLILIYLWRVYIQHYFGLRYKENSIIIGSGEELSALEKEVNDNSKLGLHFVSSIDLDKVTGVDFTDEITKRVYSDNVSVIVVDLKDSRVEPILPHLYNFIFSNVKFIDMDRIYEDVFDRVPLSLLRYSWFLENISVVQNTIYSFLKRSADIFVSVIFGLIYLILFPFIAIAIKIEDNGPILFYQNRIGKNNKIIKVAKFRSMDVAEKEKITKVGRFLRKTRIDELPQMKNVFVGDLSLVGPRPEKPDFVELYDKEIPYYNVRHLIKPGLSGWAQICQDNPPKFDVNFDDTKTKLSYDLYYIKNKSIILDIKIALKTIKTLISRVGE